MTASRTIYPWLVYNQNQSSKKSGREYEAFFVSYFVGKMQWQADGRLSQFFVLNRIKPMEYASNETQMAVISLIHRRNQFSWSVSNPRFRPFKWWEICDGNIAQVVGLSSLLIKHYKRIFVGAPHFKTSAHTSNGWTFWIKFRVYVDQYILFSMRLRMWNRFAVWWHKSEIVAKWNIFCMQDFHCRPQDLSISWIHLQSWFYPLWHWLTNSINRSMFCDRERRSITNNYMANRKAREITVRVMRSCVCVSAPCVCVYA